MNPFGPPISSASRVNNPFASDAASPWANFWNDSRQQERTSSNLPVADPWIGSQHHERVPNAWPLKDPRTFAQQQQWSSGARPVPNPWTDGKQQEWSSIAAPVRNPWTDSQQQVGSSAVRPVRDPWTVNQQQQWSLNAQPETMKDFWTGSQQQRHSLNSRTPPKIDPWLTHREQQDRQDGMSPKVRDPAASKWSASSSGQVDIPVSGGSPMRPAQLNGGDRQASPWTACPAEPSQYSQGAWAHDRGSKHPHPFLTSWPPETPQAIPSSPVAQQSSAAAWPGSMMEQQGSTASFHTEQWPSPGAPWPSISDRQPEFRPAPWSTEHIPPTHDAWLQADTKQETFRHERKHRNKHRKRRDEARRDRAASSPPEVHNSTREHLHAPSFHAEVKQEARPTPPFTHEFGHEHPPLGFDLERNKKAHVGLPHTHGIGKEQLFLGSHTERSKKDQRAPDFEDELMRGMDDMLVGISLASKRKKEDQELQEAIARSLEGQTAHGKLAEGGPKGERRKGILVRVVEATGLQSVRVLGRKMDPYVEVSFGPSKARTSVCNGGHTEPFWDEVLGFPVQTDLHGQQVEFTVFDKNKLMSDAHIGSGSKTITREEALQDKVNRTVTLISKKNGQEAGTLHMTLEFLDAEPAQNQSSPSGAGDASFSIFASMAELASFA